LGNIFLNKNTKQLSQNKFFVEGSLIKFLKYSQKINELGLKLLIFHTFEYPISQK